MHLSVVRVGRGSWDGSRLRLWCVVAATRYGPDSGRPTVDGDQSRRRGRCHARIRGLTPTEDAIHPQYISTYLTARAEWIPNDRARRRQRRYIGSGLRKKANDRSVARRQKRWGMQWGAQTSDALAAVRTLALNEGWDTYGQKRQTFSVPAA